MYLCVLVFIFKKKCSYDVTQSRTCNDEHQQQNSCPLHSFFFLLQRIHSFTFSSNAGVECSRSESDLASRSSSGLAGCGEARYVEHTTSSFKIEVSLEVLQSIHLSKPLQSLTRTDKRGTNQKSLGRIHESRSKAIYHIYVHVCVLVHVRILI